MQLYKEKQENSQLKKSLGEMSNFSSKIQYRYGKIMDFMEKK